MVLLSSSQLPSKASFEYFYIQGPLAENTTGEPADNACHFIHWLEGLKANELAGVRYGVFGCGNHDWVHTFQRIPKLCDHLLEARGGTRLVPRGVGDAGEGTFFQVFAEFEMNLWQVLCKVFSCSSAGYSNRSLTSFSDRSIKLPETTRQSRRLRCKPLILDRSGQPFFVSLLQRWAKWLRIEY